MNDAGLMDTKLDASTTTKGLKNTRCGRKLTVESLGDVRRVREGSGKFGRVRGSSEGFGRVRKLTIEFGGGVRVELAILLDA